MAAAQLFTGDVAPENHCSAPAGAIYIDLSDGQLYAKQQGDGNTGWIAVGASQEGVAIDETWSDSHSHQSLAADLTLGAAAGKDLTNTAFLAPIMGNVHGASLTKSGDYIAGVIGEDSVTGTKGTHMVKGGVVGIVADGVTASDGAVVAVLDGDDGGTTTPEAMFNVMKFNSTPGNDPNYGVNLQRDAADGFSVLAYKKAAIRLGGDVVLFFGDGAPSDGTTGANFAGEGSMYVRTHTGAAAVYINTGTKASPVWKAITHA